MNKINKYFGDTFIADMFVVFVILAICFISTNVHAGGVINPRTGNPLSAYGAITAGHCAEFFDAYGNLQDSGAACGGGGGGGNLNSINADTSAAQTLTVGTAGSDFNITDPGAGAHVFNLPDASAVSRGALNSTDWTIFNNKIDGTGNPGSVTYWQSGSFVTSNIFFVYNGAGDATGSFLGVGVTTALEKLHIGGNARIDGTLRVNPDAGNQNLLVNGPIRLGSGVSIASVDDAVASNTPLELRATTLQLTAVGPGTVKLSTETPGPTILDVLGVTSDANGGQVTIGNSAAAGTVSGTQRYVDISQTITDFTPVDSWRLLGARLVVNPVNDSPSDTATTWFSQISIPNTNANDFGNLIADVAIASHSGSGAVNQNIGRITAGYLGGAGSIATNAADSVTCQATAASAGTITNNYCHVFNSGNQSAGSTVVNDFVSVYRTPRTDGPVTNHRAIYAEDQSGADNDYFMYSEGGQSYHAGNFGIQNTTPPAPLTIANNIYEGLTYDGAGGWGGNRTAIELLAAGVRSSWQSTTGEEGLGVRFGTETAHPLFIRTNDTNAITINTSQQTDFSAAATFENDVSVNGRILGQLGTVTAANDITLPANGNVISIGSSAVPVNTIDYTGWTPGSTVIFICTSTFVFHHNTAGSGGPLLLAGSVDYTCVPNGTLTVALDGTSWQETARKSP